MKKMKNKLIIDFTPTGMIPTKKMTPFVPISENEIIEDVHSAFELGITKVHLHARNSTSGEPTYKKEIYGKIIEGIRKFAPYLIICVSLSGRTHNQLELRADPLNLKDKLKPDMASLTLSSLNFNKKESVNSPETIKQLAFLMKEKGIMPELEAFDLGIINYAKYLAKKKLIEPPYYFNLLLGNIAGAQSQILHTGMMINDLPEPSIWSLAGLGNTQLMINTLSIVFGGGVRVGLEDNIWYDSSKTKLSSNIELLKRIHLLADMNERKIMDGQELRKILNLNPGNGFYGLKQD